MATPGEQQACADDEAALDGTEPTAIQSFAKRARLDAGAVVDGKYVIQGVLGEGSMGIVFSAQHKELHEPVALKFLVSNEEGLDFRARFRREAQICAKIRNEHISRVLDVGTWQGEAYMVMEYLSGSDLATVLGQTGTLSVRDAVDYLVQLCTGLAEVHAHGIVHRDLKPTNVFLTRRSDGSALLKILDFGISKWTNEPEDSRKGLTKVGVFLGTPEYMAPEQLFGSNTVDCRADVWSLGAILYESLTGTTPFIETTFAKLCAELGKGDPPKAPRTRRPELPVELDAAIMLCLQPDLEKRIPNVAVLAGELLAAVGDPNADAVRTKLEGVLERISKSSGGGRVSNVPPSSGSMRSGAYVAQSLRSSSSLSPVVDPTHASSTPAVPAPASAPPATPAEVARSSRGRNATIAIAACVLAVVGYVAISRKMTPASAEPATATRAPEAVERLPTAAPTLGAAAVVQPSATPAIAADPPPVTPAPTATGRTIATAATTARPAALVGGRRPNGALPLAAPATPAPPAETAAPSAAPAAPPKKPANPLEDRQ